MQVIVSGAADIGRLRSIAGQEFTFREQPRIGRAAFQVLQNHEAGALIVPADCLDPTALSSLAALRRHGAVVPVILLFRHLTADSIRAAWSAGPSFARIAFSDEEVHQILICLKSQHNQLVTRVCTALRFPSGVLTDLVRILASTRASCTDSADALARRIGVGRATLFRHLRAAHAPRIEDLQVLFQLIRSVSSLAAGASTEASSYAGGFSDASALRRALIIKLDSTIHHARTACEPGWVVEAWLARTCDRPQGRDECACNRSTHMALS